MNSINNSMIILFLKDKMTWFFNFSAFFSSEKYKKSILIFSVILFSTPLFSQQFGQFTDSRDGNIYKTIQIGNQTWMAENLRFRPSSGNYFMYNNDNNNVYSYGYLYDWSTACNVCPSGWKSPSNNEWLELTTYVGANYKNKMMKSIGWPVGEGNTNESGFSAIPGGMRDHNGGYRAIGQGAFFWTSKLSDQNFSFAREFGKNGGNYASAEFGTNKYMGLSVRCLKNVNTIQVEPEEKIESEYEEAEFQEPEAEQYPDDYPIEKSIKDYIVFKTQYCTEKQDGYYNYLEEYECKPSKTATIKLTINIHLNDPMYDEAKISIKNLTTKKNEEFDIERVELSEEGNKIFYFSVINQPHTFTLDEINKKIIWFSEWGHWQQVYYYK